MIAAEGKLATLIVGVVGDDPHIVGLSVLTTSLRAAGFEVVSLGAFVQPQRFIDVAKETKADAILVSSLNGSGLDYAAIFRDLVQEEGLEHIPLYMGGNLVLGKQPWEEVEQRFMDLGFRRVYPPGVHPRQVCDDLTFDLAEPSV